MAEQPLLPYRPCGRSFCLRPDDGHEHDSVPINEYDPVFTDEDYAVFARLLDEVRASRAARLLDEQQRAS